MSGICVTIRPEDTPRGFEAYLSKFMARYYASAQVRFGDKESIELDGQPTATETQTAWMLLDAAGMEYYELQLQAA